MACKPLRVDNNSYNKATIQKVYNSLIELTKEGTDRDPNLSNQVVKNIELMPIYLVSTENDVSPAIHIGFSPTVYANDAQGRLQDQIKLINISIDIFLGKANSSETENLAILQSDFKDDIEYVLDPKNFVGSPFGHRDVRDSALFLENAIENGELTGQTASHATRLIQLYQNQAPLPRGATINDAGIISWIPNPETRASGSEVLTAIFQLQLNYSTNVSQR